MSLLKSKTFYIIVVVVSLAISGFAYSRYKKSHQPSQYDTVKVAQGDLTRTVEATGKVQSTSDLSLRFETAGAIAAVKVSEGDKVKEGDWLENLDTADLEAAVAKARADLNLKLAGSTSEELASLQALVDNAKSALYQAKTDASSSVSTAESTLETAKNNLKLTQGGASSTIVNSAYNSAVTILQKTGTVLDDGLTQADNILGIDNTMANDNFKSLLSLLSASALQKAQDLYQTAKKEISQADALILPLTTASAHEDIDTAIADTETALTGANQLLSSVAGVLKASPAAGNLSQTTLDAKKTTITTARASVSAQYSSLVSQAQAISDAKNSYTTYKIAYDKAVNDLATAQANADTSVQIKQAAYKQAVANLKDKQNPPRDVDVASYRALLAQAIANRDKAILKSPMDGLITKINKKKGEYASISDVVIQMSAPHYEVAVDVPETDVAKVSVGDGVTTTLDAFGDDVKFSGKVISIEPQSTEIQDVVYYKVTVSINTSSSSAAAGKQVKTGMTANVSINADKNKTLSNVLYIPWRAVLSRDSIKYVRVLDDKNQVSEVNVKIGAKADNGMAVVTDGLKEGQTVVLSVKK